MLSTKVLELKSSSEVIRHLKGLICIYKPPDIQAGKLLHQINEKIIEELNEMEQTERFLKYHSKLELDKVDNMSHGDFLRVFYNPKAQLYTNYAPSHLVMGNLYQEKDLRSRYIDYLQYRTSGLSLITYNYNNLRNSIFNSKLLKIYRIKVEIGKFTKNGFSDGKVIEKVKNPYFGLEKLIKILSSIQSSHQRESFKYSKVSLQSQEAYELASKGPLRPAEETGTLIYNIQCVDFELPFFELEVTCINETEGFLVDFIHEIGQRLKTGAVCTSIRCIKYGCFTLPDALLLKNISLESVISNMYSNKALYQENKTMKSQLFKKVSYESDLIE